MSIIMMIIMMCIFVSLQRNIQLGTGRKQNGQEFLSEPGDGTPISPC